MIGLRFHAKSEHTFSGRNNDSAGHYPLELHIVHQKEGSNGTKDIIIVAVMFNIKRTPGSNRFLDQVDFHNLPVAVGDSKVLSAAVDLNELAYSLQGDFFAYNGSLTNPGCTENVQWRVLSQAQGMTQSQLDSLLKFFRNTKEFPNGRGNYRHVQKRNGREVVLFKRNVFPAASHSFRPFQWVRTEAPASGGVVKLN